MPEEARETATRQSGRLREIRGASTLEKVSECFLLPDPEPEEEVSGGPRVDYRSQQVSSSASIDRMMARSGALSKAVEGFDDDID